MAIQIPQTEISPYTSQVPLVQIPPEVISGNTRPSGPLQGEFKGKGTGAWILGDSLLKGFMQGHQIKEQKKYAQAEATIKAADAASESAYQEYQNALTNAGGKVDDPKAQAAYEAYKTTFNAGKQAKAQFVMPEKGQKGKKSAANSSDPTASADKKGGKDKKQASAGFNSIKDFFEANPAHRSADCLNDHAAQTTGVEPQGLKSKVWNWTPLNSRISKRSKKRTIKT